jgi:hypothetical protein
VTVFSKIISMDLQKLLWHEYLNTHVFLYGKDFPIPSYHNICL